MAFDPRHNELLTKAINAAKSVAWGNCTPEALEAERETKRKYLNYCREVGTEPLEIRVVS